MFMKPSGVKTRTLADIINEKITEKKTEIDTQFTDTSEVARDIDPKVAEMYTEVAKLLSRYRSGKIPKAFKVLPQFRNWEQLLYLTNPDGWSAAAMYQVSILKQWYSHGQSAVCYIFSKRVTSVAD